MSAEATGYVWKHSPYTGANLLVHLAIADSVNDIHENEFWMSTANLAKKARCSRSTASGALAHMCERGYLRMLVSGKADRTPSRYVFVFHRQGNMTGQRSSPSAISAESHDRTAGTNPISTTQEPNGKFSTGHEKCIRCGGTGRIWNGEGGFEMACPSVTV